MKAALIFMICRECDRFISIANTDKCGYGICQRGNNWQMIDMNGNCIYEPKKYHCADCQHYVECDTACLTAEPSDDICCGFEDAKYYQLINILFDWVGRGKIDDECRELFEAALKEAKNI